MVVIPVAHRLDAALGEPRQAEWFADATRMEKGVEPIQSPTHFRLIEPDIMHRLIERSVPVEVLELDEVHSCLV